MTAVRGPVVATRRDDLRMVLATKDACYDALLDGAGNPIVRATHARTSRLRGMTLQAPGRSADTRRELRAITAATTSGDASAACDEHLRSAVAVAMEQLHAPVGGAA